MYSQKPHLEHHLLKNIYLVLEKLNTLWYTLLLFFFYYFFLQNAIVIFYFKGNNIE